MAFSVVNACNPTVRAIWQLPLSRSPSRPCGRSGTSCPIWAESIFRRSSSFWRSTSSVTLSSRWSGPWRSERAGGRRCRPLAAAPGRVGGSSSGDASRRTGRHRRSRGSLRRAQGAQGAGQGRAGEWGRKRCSPPASRKRSRLPRVRGRPGGRRDGPPQDLSGRRRSGPARAALAAATGETA